MSIDENIKDTIEDIRNNFDRLLNLFSNYKELPAEEVKEHPKPYDWEGKECHFIAECGNIGYVSHSPTHHLFCSSDKALLESYINAPMGFNDLSLLNNIKHSEHVNDTFIPKDKEERWFIYYCYKEQIYTITFLNYTINGTNVYFESVENAEKALEMFKHEKGIV